MSGAYTRTALQGLGWLPQAGEQFSSAQLIGQLAIVPEQQPLFGRLLEFLAEDGLLQAANPPTAGRPAPDQAAGQLAKGTDWQVASKVDSPPDPELIESLLRSQYTECDAELTLLGRCGRQLAAVLSGQIDPVELLFPDGNSTLVERLYQDSPFARTLNTLVEESILQALAGVSENRPVKILEIGGGTGGTSSQILPRLPADRTEYLFTDVSELFTRAARKKFRRFSFVRYRVLDIEQDPTTQGFAAGQFDLILAANVIHATRDLQQTMTHVRTLLAPGGLAVLLEGMQPARWLDLTFGLTTGWWRFADWDLRPNYPLLGAAGWLELLDRCGFQQAATLPGLEAATAGQMGERNVPQGVILAQNGDCQAPQAAAQQPAGRPSAPQQPIPSTRRRWLVLADQSGVGAALVERLQSGGDRCVVVQVGKRFQKLDENHFLVDPARP